MKITLVTVKIITGYCLLDTRAASVSLGGGFLTLYYRLFLVCISVFVRVLVCVCTCVCERKTMWLAAVSCVAFIAPSPRMQAGFSTCLLASQQPDIWSFTTTQGHTHTQMHLHIHTSFLD